MVKIKATFNQCRRAIQGRKHRAFVDICIVGLAGYFTLKKYFGWSVTQWLGGIFTPPLIPFIVTPLLVIAVYATLMKVFLVACDFFPSTRVRMIDPQALNHCLLRINQEIQREWQEIVGNPSQAATVFTNDSQFVSNIGLVVKNFVSHIKESLAGAEEKDVFVSVYSIPNFQDLDAPRGSLTYVTHYDVREDWIHSREIIFASEKYKNYECVKCIKSPLRTRILLDCKNDYAKSESSRLKKVEHYIGMKLQVEHRFSGFEQNILLGFVNIEFHNKRFFSSEEEMSEYVKQHMVAFKYLLEHYFLKSLFLATVKSKLSIQTA